MGLFFPDYGTSFGKAQGQKYSVLTVTAAHLALLGLIAYAVPSERLAEITRPFTARLIELAPKEPPPPPKQPKKPLQAPLPVMTAAAPVPQSQPTFTVAPQPPAPPVPVPLTAAPVVLASAARFDADYLNNPKPHYPSASRRLREEGEVMLRVRVSAAGLAENVEIKHSSGFIRLDQAAVDAVTRWRFVPARRGDEAVAAWVQVPITFNLQG